MEARELLHGLFSKNSIFEIIVFFIITGIVLGARKIYLGLRAGNIVCKKRVLNKKNINPSYKKWNLVILHMPRKHRQFLLF